MSKEVEVEAEVEIEAEDKVERALSTFCFNAMMAG